MSRAFGVKLKHCSKAGTAAHRRREPAKEGRVARALRRFSETANKKSVRVKRGIRETTGKWNYKVYQSFSVRCVRYILSIFNLPGKICIW